MPVPSLTAHTTAMIAKITTAMAGSTVRVGDAEKPAGAGWQSVPDQSTFVPYCIVYALNGDGFDGHLGPAFDQVELEWQITCVGANRLQAEGVADRVLSIVGGQLTVTGRSVPLIRPVGTAHVFPDESVQPTVWVATPQLAAWSTPS